MGLKRIMGQYEVTFPADDSRDVLELAEQVPGRMASGIEQAGGTMARAVVLGAYTDPDPEPTADDIVPVDPTGPGGPLEWA